jgi:hypothetical protein
MQVVERNEHEEHFSEGEPDLEPPEELAIGELDETMLLEEDLDSEAILEQDVDEDTLEVTLEDLVHLDDDDEPLSGQPASSAEDVDGALDALDELDAETLDVADMEESLDRVLRERLALKTGDGNEDEGEDEEGSGSPARPARPEEPTVAPCGADEFVCRGCFLVRHRVQLADPKRILCHDCAQ